MPPQEEKNRIEDLKQTIYSRNAPDIHSRRKIRYTTEIADSTLKKEWDRPKDEPETASIEQEFREERKSMSFFTKILIGSVIFCILAVSAGAFIFFKGGFFISGENINIHISGPVSVPGGTEVPISVVVTNHNTVALKSTDLKIKFPAGTTDAQDTTKSMEDYEEMIGEIPPGGSVTKSVTAVIFGEENTQKSITAIITYGLEGTNSTFTRETSYDLVINSSPVVVTVTSPKEVTSGQPFDINVSVKSNSANTLKNVLIKGQYPFGYKFESASVKPSTADNTTWNIGDIPPGASRSIIVHGALTGEDTESRSFHFTAGAKSPSNPAVIGTIFMDAVQDITIQKAFVSLTIGIDNNNDGDDFVGQFNRSQNVNIRWKNNLPEALSNVSITAHLSGSAYDKTYVTAYTGFYRSVSDDIVWNQQTNPELASVAAGSSGVVSFAITPVQSGTRITNPTLVISGTVSGNRTSNTNTVLSTAPTIRTVKITSNVSLSGRVVRSSGPFVNTGPVPPVAEQKTSYTVIWSVDNTSNQVQNAVVSATIPPYVSWMSQVSPSSEDVSFDKNTGTITWQLGSVRTYTQGTSARREVAFQIAILPSIDQVGQSPIIMNQASLTGTDTWTESTIQSNQGYLTTSFSTDPAFRHGDGVVAKPF